MEKSEKIESMNWIYIFKSASLLKEVNFSHNRDVLVACLSFFIAYFLLFLSFWNANLHMT